MIRIAVLVSGNGSNLQALIDAPLTGQIVGVVSNKANAYALQRAHNARIPTAIIQNKDFLSRELFDDAMHQQLIEWKVDLVVLAGFMRILSPQFVQNWEGKMLNLHPSLLPLYKGMHTHQRVLNTGDRLHGCTVHFVTPELDAGQPIAQSILEVSHKDTVDTLAQRIHRLEHVLYPRVVQWFCSKQLTYQNGQAIFDGQVMRKPLTYYS